MLNTKCDRDTLYALTSYYAERWSEPNISAIERETVLITYHACLFALGLWRPSASRLTWSEMDPHERIHRWFQDTQKRAEDANRT